MKPEPLPESVTTRTTALRTAGCGSVPKCCGSHAGAERRAGCAGGAAPELQAAANRAQNTIFRDMSPHRPCHARVAQNVFSQSPPPWMAGRERFDHQKWRDRTGLSRRRPLVEPDHRYPIVRADVKRREGAVVDPDLVLDLTHVRLVMVDGDARVVDPEGSTEVRAHATVGAH